MPLRSCTSISFGAIGPLMLCCFLYEIIIYEGSGICWEEGQIETFGTVKHLCHSNSHAYSFLKQV